MRLWCESIENREHTKYGEIFRRDFERRGWGLCVGDAGGMLGGVGSVGLDMGVMGGDLGDGHADGTD